MTLRTFAFKIIFLSLMPQHKENVSMSRILTAHIRRNGVKKNIERGRNALKLFF